MLEPLQVSRYACPVEGCSYLGKNYEKAKQHVNQPVFQLPLGFVFGTPKVEVYDWVFRASMQRNHDSYQTMFSYDSSNNSLNRTGGFRATEILKRIHEGVFQLLEEERFQKLIAEPGLRNFGRAFNIEGFVRDTPQIQEWLKELGEK